MTDEHKRGHSGHQLYEMKIRDTKLLFGRIQGEILHWLDNCIPKYKATVLLAIKYVLLQKCQNSSARIQL